MFKTLGVPTTFGRSDAVSRGKRKGLCTFSKVSKTWWVLVAFQKNDGRRGTFEEDLQRCISPGRRSTRDMFIRDVRRSGRWFPERGCILEHQICRFPKMILRDRCSISYDLASIFRGRRSTLDRWSGKNRKTHWYEAVSAALNFSCFEGSLAELLCFWCCQIQKLKKSRGIASFWMLSSSKIEASLAELLRFLYAVIAWKKSGSLAEYLQFSRQTDRQVQTDRQTERRDR